MIAASALIFLGWFAFTLPILYIPVPAAVIASMPLSCGAGHADDDDDVSKKWREERIWMRTAQTSWVGTFTGFGEPILSAESRDDTAMKTAVYE